MAPDPAGDAGDALDALAAQVKPKDDAAPPVEPKDTTPAAPTPEEKAAAEAAAAKAAEDAEHAKRAETLFKDSPTLAPNASVKSSEAFSAVKVQAAREIAAREAELEKIRKENAELQEKLKNTAPPEALKELSEHREWRARLDIEADPKFKEFDKQIAQTHEFIYAQLKKNPAVSDDLIAQIKKIGGPDKTDFSKLWPLTNDPALQRLVESKVADIEMTKFNKQQAIESAKQNVQQYMAQRQEQYAKSVTQHRDVTQQTYDNLAGKLEWFKPETVKAGADAAEKARVEDYNKFITETQGQLKEALNDDSPQMRAVMLTGMAQLFYLQRKHDQTLAEKTGLEKQVAELSEKLDRFKKASLNRIKEGGAAPGAEAKIEKKEGQLNVHTGDALDTLAKQVMEERQRVANTGR
jgi:hypothetical protein